MFVVGRVDHQQATIVAIEGRGIDVVDVDILPGQRVRNVLEEFMPLTGPPAYLLPVDYYMLQSSVVPGKAAEHSTAVLMALKNKMDLAFHVGVGSGIQIALFVAPVLVFASMFMGHSQPLDLHFTPLEVIAVALSVGVLALVSFDGETHWMEGVMRLGVYVIFALAFYHLPEAAEAAVSAAGHGT